MKINQIKYIHDNIYIDKYKNFIEHYTKGEYGIDYHNIKHIVNLTECKVFSARDIAYLLSKNIEAYNLFEHTELAHIKKILKSDRSNKQKEMREKIRESIVSNHAHYIESLSRESGGILFICSQNNVLSPTFALIILSLRAANKNKFDYIKVKQKVFEEINTSAAPFIALKYQHSIKIYLDKYIQLIYNRII